MLDVHYAYKRLQLRMITETKSETYELLALGNAFF